MNLLFEPLFLFIQKQTQERRERDELVWFKTSRSNQLQSSEDIISKKVSQIGAKMKVNWEKGFRVEAWMVCDHCTQLPETLTLMYASEPLNPYEELTLLIGKGKIKLHGLPCNFTKLIL